MPELIIEADNRDRQYWRDLWAYRELFYFLAWRDLLVRYKQTVVGIAWSVLRPFLTMMVLTVVFGKLGNMPSGGVAYPLLVFCGMLPWQFFSAAFSESGNSLVNNYNLISKVYFPRLAVPVSTVLTSLVDFLISVVFLVVLMIWYTTVPPAQIILLPVFIFLALATSFGAGVWVAALTVRYRDFRIIIPFLVQLGLYISPVGFVSTVVPDQWRLVYFLNPIAGAIDGFRWCILGGRQELYLPGLVVSLTTATIITFGGIWYFRATESEFADII